MKATLSIIFALTILPYQPAFATQKRFEYPYEHQILNKDASPRYSGQETIESKDIVIFGDTVFIDQPVLSNGGDVVILAEKLVVNAPLDSRVYLKHDAGFLAGAQGSCATASDWLRSVPAALDSYKLFYTMSDDVWDAASNTYKLAQQEKFPEIPSGITNCATHGAFSSSGALKDDDIHWKDLKSGNITIAANSIEFCPTCGQNPTGWTGKKAEIPERANTPFEEATFFNARGLRGSRGDIKLYGCTASFGNADSRCGGFSIWPREGTRDIGSHGGDAGKVTIYMINNTDWLNTHRLDLLNRISSQGGQGGAVENLLAPCWGKKNGFSPHYQCDPAPTQPSRLVFTQSGSNGPTSDGSGTEPFIRDADSASAVSLIASTLIALESDKLKSYKSLLEAAGDVDTILQYVSPLDHLTEFLKNAKVEVNIAGIRAAQFMGARNLRAPTYSKLFAHLDISPTANAGVDSQSYNLVLQLAPYNAVYSNASLTNYTRDILGLFQFTVKDPVQRIVDAKLNVKLVELRKALSQVSQDIMDERLDTFQFWKEQFSNEFQARLDGLQISIGQAERAAQEYEKLKKLESHFTNLISGVASLVGNFYSGNYLGMSSTLANMIDDVSAIDEAVRYEEDAAQLRQVYEDTVRQLNDTINRMNDVKKKMYEQSKDAMYNMLEIRSEYTREYLEALSYHEDLWRLSVATFAKSGNAIDLQFNMTELETLNTSFPEKNVNLSRLDPLSPTCPNENPPPISTVLRDNPLTPVTCAMSEPDLTGKQWTELAVKSGPLAGAVLWRFPPGANQRKMELFGIFPGQQLEWRAVSN